MRTRSRWMRILCALMIMVIAACAAGCQQNRIMAADLMEGITPGHVEALEDLSTGNTAVADFAMRLLQAARHEGNTLVSPLSVLYALAMTANGAAGETLEQMEQVLGLPIGDLNRYLYSFMAGLSKEESASLKLANAIWFRDAERLKVNPEFLQTNADCYGADIRKAPFNEQTKKDINDWVKDKTDGMIPEILDRISETSVLYLINALAFDAKWIDPYMEYSVRDGEFTLADGQKKTVNFMFSEEHTYLENDMATGFMKYYQGGRYAFAALLPREGVSVEMLADSLTGEAVQKLLSDASGGTVLTSLPKFEVKDDLLLNAPLMTMGMPLAFDEALADFSEMAHSDLGNIFIGPVLHKTFMSVNEDGTRAGAATIVEMRDAAAFIEDKPKEVYLDRPFVYFLIDTETNIPFFAGIMNDPAE